jgi:PAS domain S-box-containing protein
MASSRSIARQVLLPILLVTAATFAIVLVGASRTALTVREDYDRLSLTAAASHVDSILDLAGSELTAARLDDNPVVAEAKRATVVLAIRGFWSRARLDGVVLSGDGAVVATTLDEAATRAVATARTKGFFTALAGDEPLRCQAEPFPAWGWDVITVGRRPALGQLRPELAWLVPLLGVAAVLLAGSTLLLLWRRLRSPVARMVADVRSSHEVRAVGVAELDLIGEAVNSTMARLRARTVELTEELERRQQAERALEEKEARVRLLLNSTAEGIFGVDTQGTCTFCNPAAARLLGLASQEGLLGRNAHELVHRGRPDGSPYPSADCPVLRTSRTGLPARVNDEVFWRKDGTHFPVEFWSYPILENGELRGAVVGFVDTTERSALEQQLRQAQKMEAVGRLAGGIAHDFNNMLMAIIGHTSLAREAAPPGSALQEDLGQALAAADKAAGLTRQILAFSRSRAATLAPTEVNEVVGGMGKVLTRLVGEDVQVEFKLADEPMVAMADRAQLEQVLLNLWTNARDAMPHGGRLTVSTRTAACDRARAAELGLEAPGGYAVLAVSDTGVGMDEETRQRAFEPFFTTKEQGKGTGLGLSIVYGIVKQHHGQVAIASAPGNGSTFEIYVPLSARAAAEQQPAAAARATGGHETVLVAEDNDQVRELTRKVLEGAGYTVLAARDGEEALAMHEGHADEIALCLFDVVMPRLGGREALDALRQRRPGARAVLMSGYAPDRAGAEADDVPLLAKPFVPRELLRYVRDAIDRV